MSDSCSGSGIDVRFLFGFWDGCQILVRVLGWMSMFSYGSNE
jgi:hypothetical protein